MMQKLVTIYLDVTAYGLPKSPVSYTEKHGHIEEHLQEYLADGWNIRQLHSLPGADGCRGWVTAVLERGA